jgi:hypothetical protein
VSASSRFVAPYQSPLGAGVIVPLGELNFFETGSDTVRQNTYADAALTVPNPNPVIADGAGQFPNIFLIDGLSYRVKFTTTSVPPATPFQFWSADPVAAELPANFVGDTGSGGEAGSVPAPPAGSAAQGFVLLANGLWGIPLVVPPASSVAINQPGFLLIPERFITANWTLVLADAAGAIVSNTATPLTVTIPLDATAGWTAGAATPVVLHVPQGMGQFTISPAAGVTLLGPTAFTTSGNRIVSTNGLATLTRWSTNYWTIAGPGVS